MNLVLHIGTEKTGTTSIQEFLKKNIDQLKRNSIYIPQTPISGNGNHRWIPLFANNDVFSDEFVLSRQFKNYEDRKEVIFQKRNQFIDECLNASRKYKTIILTSEHFQSRLRTKEEIRRLRDLLEEVASKIHIIIYIRDPLKTAVSSFSTMIKSGSTASVLPSPDQKNYLCNHSQTIQKWKDCFPNSDFTIRRFEESLLVKEDVVFDFCSHIIDDFREKDYTYVQRNNQTLSLTGMALLRELNVQFPRFIDGKPNRMRGQISKFIMRNTLDGSKFLPSKDEFQAYKNYYHESSEIVRSHYFPAEQSLFIEQQEFAEQRINLTEVVVDSQIFEELIKSLWMKKRRLEFKLDNKN